MQGDTEKVILLYRQFYVWGYQAKWAGRMICSWLDAFNVKVTHDKTLLIHYFNWKIDNTEIKEGEKRKREWERERGKKAKIAKEGWNPKKRTKII